MPALLHQVLEEVKYLQILLETVLRLVLKLFSNCGQLLQARPLFAVDNGRNDEADVSSDAVEHPSASYHFVNDHRQAAEKKIQPR